MPESNMIFSLLYSLFCRSAGVTETVPKIVAGLALQWTQHLSRRTDKVTLGLSRMTANGFLNTQHTHRGSSFGGRWAEIKCSAALGEMMPK